jgi:hypothetical protein
LKISAARDDRRLIICSAIRQLRPIEFYYHGGYRTVEPFALGIVLNSREDNESLLCYQTGGFSELLEVVGWKLYRVSDMEDIEVMKEHFTGDRPGYDPEKLEMVTVICCVRPLYHAEEEIKEPPKEEVRIESSPIPIPVYEPPPAPVVVPQPIIRYLTHNELMERFRYAHPMPIPELDTTLWPEPLVKPFPERVESKIWATTPVLGNTRYLIGQPA